MFNFEQPKKLLVTTSTQTVNKKGEPVTYVTVLGDDYKTSDLYLKGSHVFVPNTHYDFQLSYIDTPWKYIAVNSFKPSASVK